MHEIDPSRGLATTAAAALAIATPARAEGSADGVGAVSDIVNVGWGTVAPEPREEIEFEDAVYMNELIETDDESAIVVKFSDGSKLTVGENAKVTIDKYVYDPVQVEALKPSPWRRGPSASSRGPSRRIR